MDDKNSARRELGFARWYKEIERRFSLSDAGGARNEGGAASRGNALPPPSTRLLAGRGAAGMKSGLRFAAVALLFLAGFLGVFEAARAQTVIWSATLEAGSTDSTAGYHHLDNIGSLSNRHFTYKGKSFTVDSFYTSTVANATYLDVPASGPRLTTDLFGTSSDPNPVTLHAGTNNWMGSGQGSSQSLFTATIAVLFDSVFVDGNTYSVSITTTAPGAPQSLSTTATSTSEVALNWSAPSSIGGSAISGYKYRYKASGEDFGAWTAISGSANLRSYVVGDLEDSTDYIFQMLATNKSGDGLHSGEVTGSTLAGQPTVILVLDRNRISEDRGESTVTAILDRTSSVATTVTVSASAVSPATASDFTLSSNKVLTIAAEQTTSTGTVTITAVDNAADDDNRQVTVSGVAMNAGGVTQPSSQTLTIADDESASTTVTLTVSPTRIQEGATGAAQAVTVTAELDGDAREENTQVAVSVSGDTAVAGTDYTAVPEFTFTIAAGRTSGAGTFTLAPIADNLDGPDVTVTVTGTTTSGLPVEPESGLTVTIEDDDAPAATLVLDPDSIVENGGVSTVTATLDHPSIEDISIAVSASPLFPAEAGDFTLSATKTLTITAGQTTSTGAVTITANNDDVSAPDKSVTVSGEATSEGDLTPPEDVTLTITDDDATSTKVTLTVSPRSVSEGATDDADRTVTVTATLDAAARTEATEVTVSVAGGTAVEGTDFSEVGDITVTIAANQTSGTGTFVLEPANDDIDEPAETVLVTGATTASGLSVAPSSGLTVTIEDDDATPEPTLVLDPDSIGEDAGESTVSATLVRPSSAVTTIVVSATPVSPAEADDFTLSSNKTLTIAAGDTTSTGTVTITGVNNSDAEAAKSITVTGAAMNNHGVTQPSSRTLTITDDETSSAKVTLTVSPTSVAEDATGTDRTVTVTATLDGDSRSEDTEVTVSVAAGTAVEGTDFSAVTDVTVTIAGGTTSGTATFDLVPLDDNIDEPDETVIVSGTTTASGLTVEPAEGVTLTIEDDEAPPVISLILTPESISENRGASTVTAQLSHPSSEAVRVGAYMLYPHLYDGIVADWSANRYLTFAPEQTASTGVVTITAIDNEVDNPDRVVPIKGSLSAAVLNRGITFPQAAYLTVVDDEEVSTEVTLTVSPASVAEDATGSDRTVTVTATLDAAAREADTPVTISVSDGTAAAGTDFSAVNKFTLTIAGGATSGTATFDLVPLDDAIDEPAETVTVTGATAVPGLAVKPEGGRTVTIADDEAAPTVTLVLTPASISESSGSSMVTATLDHASSEATTIVVTASPGSGTAADDFTQSGTTLTIAAGDMTGTGTVTVTAVDNDVHAPNKSVTVSGSAMNDQGVEQPSSQTLTITENDEASTTVTLTVSPASVSEGAAGADRTVTVTATLDAAARTEDAAVTVSVTGDTATAGTDFSAVAPFTVTIEGGETSGTGTFTLAPVDDDRDEPHETVVVTGTTAVLGLTVSPEAGRTVTIVDNEDAPTVTLVLTPDSVSEARGSSTVTATLSHPSNEATTVAVSASPVSPADADDYTLSENRTLTIAAGATQSTGSVTVTAVDNVFDAPSKSVTVSGSAQNDLRVEQPSPQVLTITDDESPTTTVTLTLSPDTVSEGATGPARTVTVTAAFDGAPRPADTAVTVSVADGTAVAGTDYTAVSNVTITIATGDTSGTATFTLAPVDDNVDEPHETVVVTGTTAVLGLTVSPDAGLTVTIVDNDDAPTVTKRDQTLTGFSYSPAAVTIGDTAPTVTAPSGAQTTLSYSATPSTVCTVDSSTGALTLVGVGSCVITATAASSDDYNEATATYTVTALDRPRPITTPDEPRAPLVSSGDGSVIAQWLPPAWDGGTPILRYEYCLKPIYQCNDAWVAIPDSAPGGANHGWYAIASSNGTFTRVYLRPVNEQGAGPHVSRAAVPLTGTPAAPTNLRGEALSAEYIKISWNEPAAPAGVTITGYQLESSHDGVTWAHDFGCQYPCSQKYLGGRWQPRGTNSVTVRVLENTTLHCRIRTFFRTNTAPIVSGIDFSRGASPTSPIIVVTTVGASGTLALPELGVSDGYGHEGTNAAIVFDVRLTGAYRQTSPVTVSYRTQDGTARAGSDYTARSGTLVFEPGETAKTVSVPIIDDTVEDSGEEFALLLSNVSGAILSRSGGLGTIYNSEDIVIGFTLVDAASGTDVGGLEHGGTVTLDDPTNGQYGIRAGTAPGTGVNSVRLDLSGAKTATRTDDEAPYTLYAEGGEGLPPGAYTLQATAYPEAGGGGNALQTILVSFTVAASAQDEDEATALSATFPTSPYASKLHKGASDRPQVVVAFSEPVTAITANTPSAVVSGGTISAVSAHTEDGLENAWIFFLTPEGGGDVTFTLTAGAACDSGGICTASGTTLTEVPAARTLPGPGGDDDNTGEPETTGLTASFSAMPSEHAGPSERFTFELSFGEVPKLGFRKLRDHAFTVTGGAVRVAQRLQQGSNIGWRITVEPSGWGDVSISLPGGRACTATGAICTGDNRMLSNSPSATVQGPAALSVADSNAREGTDAALEFAVTLNRASTQTVTVHYATTHGTATAGEDYTATSGTLTFAAGDVAKTVAVPVLDDAKDEGEETMTLTLSNAANARIADGSATGTIENSDPLQKAWIARFGRTVASQVVEGITDRLGSTARGSEVRVAGVTLEPNGTAWAEKPIEEDNERVDTLEHDRTMTGRELLMQSAFRLQSASGASGDPAWTAWGRFSSASFEGETEGVKLSGDVTTGLLGADVGTDTWTAGIALSSARGDGLFALTGEMASNRKGGTVDGSLTSVHPYGQVQVTDRVALWGIGGYGAGDMTIAEEGGTPIKTDIDMTMAAAGIRGNVLETSSDDALDLVLRSGALWLRTTSDATPEMVSAQADVTRLRVMVDASRSFEIGAGGTLTPRIEAGVRRDAGDAEEGTGLELGVGLRYQASGITIEGAVRTLVAHDDAAYEEWGASAAIRIDPGTAGRGLSLRVAPTWGNAASEAEQLWSAGDAGGLVRTDDFEAESRLDAELGYGLGAPHGLGVMTPYAGLTLSDGASRTLRTGLRWNASQSATVALEANREYEGSEHAPTNALTLRAEVRW